MRGRNNLFWFGLNVFLVMLYIIFGLILLCSMLAVATEVISRLTRIHRMRTIAPDPVGRRHVCEEIGLDITSCMNEPEYDTLNSEDRDCVICLGIMEIEDIERLRCNHIFHRECLSTWMNTKYNCPTCRSKGCCVRILDDE